MNVASIEIRNLRKAIAEGLPAIDQAGAMTSQAPALTYVPPAHAQALDPERCVVEGIRGAGKSFWWAALSSEAHRAFVASAFPDAHLREGLIIKQGFGDLSNSIDAPSKDVLARIVKDFGSARPIWRAVIAHQLGFPSPFPQSSSRQKNVWMARTKWVIDHPEEYDEMLSNIDMMFAKRKQTVLILFDALDRLAETWQEIRPLAKGLLQVAQDMRSTRSVRLKLFVRPDMLEDKAIVGFPDASKLLARRAKLTWRKVDLFALFFQCIGNAAAGNGIAVRRLTSEVVGRSWSRRDQSWLLPYDLRSDEQMQELVFQRLAGKAMAASPTGLRRGKPYKWVVSHLQDGRDQVSPRSFCEALRRAAQETMADFDDHSLPLHFKTIQSGVQAASKVRVDELVNEDYPWIEQVMEPLRGNVLVPCAPKEFTNLWTKSRVVEDLGAQLKVSALSVKLPPQHLSDGVNGILEDLEELGLIQRLSDGRIQMPDVYRIAFGLGRRGGVRPLK